MHSLLLHEFLEGLGARFDVVNGMEVASDFGDVVAEYNALQNTTGVLDLSFRGRVCLLGQDRARFLHGQVTNDVQGLRAGHGCYAAIVTAKGKIQADANVYALSNELLLDFEPGLSTTVVQRLEQFIVADDVQVVDVAQHYGLLSVQGPGAGRVVDALRLFESIPGEPLQIASVQDETLGEVYLACNARLGSRGFDLFVPANAMGAVADKLVAAAREQGGRMVGWEAFEASRIEAGIPRFGSDMDETNLPPECGIEARAISYHKGCYIGQEVLNRIHTMGHVNRSLWRIEFEKGGQVVPSPRSRLLHADRETGVVTSVAENPETGKLIGMGYVRREAAKSGAELTTEGGELARLIEPVHLD